MPTGGRKFQHGDNCKNCKMPVFEDNSVYKGDRLIPYCNSCWPEIRDSFQSRTKEARRYQYVAWKFGLSPEEYERRVQLQLGGCAICKQPCNVRASLAVDHDHKTGVIRDLLCHRCNTLLGMVEDDELLLFKMIEYLKRHAEKTA